MPNPLDSFCGDTANMANRWPPASAQLIDMQSGHSVLAFTYRYLEAHSRPPSDVEVRNITATIARFKGPQVVPRATLESFLAGLLDTKRA
jgi:hypothetical protein